jgi:hypothetical protein
MDLTLWFISEIPNKKRPTQRAPDWWESARFRALCVA